ncbi:ADP-ribosyl-[dinitrogen reductase] glycohydrolase [Andreprevotia sp. IGB-42]|uniref:ADP-ribosylglycohydrolase family protein n=1 Tax=Andreprevotia sp. IGB-42 TaxID=2497473 RepID=UPI00135743F9|nr:ADP-ribosylglycohydrolase family protein [Andreprevotia sp. IGB-42]KAF0811594.1 ADP-ribosyl-[dinitrogen reductase] glycohydrolase [Andreprevotia sp. IGB-42]
MPTELERYRGCLLGLACGDAVGTTVEFSPRGTFAPVTDMVGGGPFDLPAGAWTDDCSMALCLVHSLLHRHGFNAEDQMNRYCNWASYGYMSSTGECFDIGMTVARALQRYRSSGDPFSGSIEPDTAGNGSLMRLAPVPMYFFENPAQVIRYAGESARTTHGAEEAIECTRLFAAQLRAGLAGESKETILFGTGYKAIAKKVVPLAAGDWRDKSINEIRGNGYVVDSLEAALWCFWHTTDFESAILAAANLGDDADTTAAICGQIAGAHYGVKAIPLHWLSRLVMGEEISQLAMRLFNERSAATINPD